MRQRTTLGLALAAAMAASGCGGGGGAMGLGDVNPGGPVSPAPSNNATLRVSFGPADTNRVETRILATTTTYTIVVETPAGTVITSANVSAQTVDSNGNVASVPVPISGSSEQVDVIVTSFNSFNGITGQGNGTATLPAGGSGSASVTLTRDYSDLDLSGNRTLNFVIYESTGADGLGSITITFDGAGNVTGGNVAVGLQAFPLEPGTYSVAQDGSFVATLNVNDLADSVLNLSGHINSDKDVAAVSLLGTAPAEPTVLGWGSMVSSIGTFSDSDVSTMDLTLLGGNESTSASIYAQAVLTTNGSGSLTGDTLNLNGNVLDIDPSTYTVASSGGALATSFQTSDSETESIPVLNLSAVMASGQDVASGIMGFDVVGAQQGAVGAFLAVDQSSDSSIADLGNITYSIHTMRLNPIGEVDIGNLTLDGSGGASGTLNDWQFPNPPALTGTPSGSTSISATYTLNDGSITFTYPFNSQTEVLTGTLNPRLNVGSGLIQDNGTVVGTFNMVQTNP